MTYYHPIDNLSLTVRFNCDACKQPIEVEVFPPHPNYMAEKAKDSHNEDCEHVCCEACEKEFEISMVSSFYEGCLEVSGISEDDVEVQENIDHSLYEDFLDKESIYSDFLYNLGQLKLMIDSQSSSYIISEYLYRLTFIGVFSCLEAYLYEKTSKMIFSNKSYQEKFLSSDPELSKEKLTLHQFFILQDIVEKKIKSRLGSLMFHNFEKVQKLYSETFDATNFPKIDDMMQFAHTRHDLVHRNGKTKDGVSIMLDAQKLDLLIDCAGKFVDAIEAEFGE